ncbi:MAG: DUF3540 domain-containing protein [Sulfurimonas sp.]|nr:DUF3540 domain-containing protein [Sulfurimonas sp.]
MSKYNSFTISSDNFKASVTQVLSDGFICINNANSYEVKKAFSCLVEPCLGDTVLLFKDHDSIFITDILVRKDSSGVEIIADSITILSKDGNINLSSDNDITIQAKENINSFATKASVVISELSLLSKIVVLKSDIFTSVVSSYQAIIEHLHLKNKSVVQQVEEHLELQCASSRKIVLDSDIYNVKEQITIAEGQVKIDAQQINMG